MISIQDEIKQSKFESNYQMALVNLVYTSNSFNSKVNSILKKKDLLNQHFNILRIIKGRKGKPVTPGEILEVMLDKKRDLTRLVDKLETLGLVKREVNPLNRRMIHIYLTQDGENVLHECNTGLQEGVYSNCGLSEDEALQLSNLLDKLRAGL